jgi:predicted transcriptional regulator
VGEQPTNERPTDRLTVDEAADALGISAGAVRNRISRGTLETLREAGRVYVLLPSGPPAGEKRPTERDTHDLQSANSALISRLEDEVVFLRRELERQQRQAEERDRENRRLLAAALERIPPQLEAPSESPEPPATATVEEAEPRPGGVQEGAQRPWWRRWIGG